MRENFSRSSDSLPISLSFSRTCRKLKFRPTRMMRPFLHLRISGSRTLGAAAFCLFAFSPSAKASLQAEGVGCPNIPVTSLQRSISFYTNVLDFKLLGTQDTSLAAKLAPGIPSGIRSRTAHLALVTECLDLTEYNPKTGVEFPEGSRGNDLWFQHVAIVVSDMNAAYERLRKFRTQFVSNVPQTLPESNRSAAGISALYFRDPDSHYLELIHFPPDKGQSKWHKRSHTLFLGIDHTAIAVSSTPASLAFYRDKLHFRVTGRSENFGTEQEHLSGVFDAHVLITSLRSESGIGIELLDYLSPGAGRPIPQDLKANDIACWQTPINVAEAGSERLHWSLLRSPSEPDNEAAWIKDPDGHLIQLLKR